MDKQTFYAQLAGKLTELGVGEEYINRHLTQFDGYFSGKSDDEVSAEISKLGSIDRVAARIKRITDKMISEEAQENPEVTDKPETVEPEVSEQIHAPHSQPEQSHQAPARQGIKRQPNSPNERKNGHPTSSRSLEPDQTEDNRRENISSAPSTEPEESKAEAQMPQPIDRPEIKTAEERQPVGYAVPDEETIKRNTTKFRIIFAATLPLTLAVLLAIAFLFGITFFAIAVLIIIAVGILVAMTAAGTFVSLFGLIFGVAQMISSMPIGLYECGLSIIIGSSVLFCGILVYNFAVRLMPYAAKWLLVFAKYVAKKLKELYIYLKKECIGI